VKRLLALVTALVAVATVSTACGPPAAIAPPIPEPIKNIFGQIVGFIWEHATAPTPPPPNQRPEDRNEVWSCAILVEPPTPDGRAPYTTIDTRWQADGWAFKISCVDPAKHVGYYLRAMKITGDENDWATMTPIFDFVIDTVPVFGRGSGHYFDFRATNITTWRKAYIRGTS
jgi:hypothetical protein